MVFVRHIVSVFIISLMSVFMSTAVLAKECTETPFPVSDVRAHGWGFDIENTRHIPANIAGLNVADVPKLKLKWAFEFEGESKVRSQPAITSDSVYVGSPSGTLYALNKSNGCVRWTFDTTWEIRTAISVGKNKKTGKDMIYFGDFRANAYGLDGETGKVIWEQRVDEHVAATITGAPKLHNGVLYVPVSSFEVALPAVPVYPCCTFRGAVVALDANNGKVLWKTPVMEEPTKRGTTALFINQYGPSGAPVWNSPTIDAKRNTLYVGTGENYSSPASNSSDSVIAMDLDTGKIKWIRQLIPNDAWNMACALPVASVNCPKEKGKDLDVGASPILALGQGGNDIILVGQKSADVWGLNPDTGEVLWNNKIGKGGALGGVHWGMAFDGEKLYVPNSDYILDIPGLIPVDPDNTNPKEPNLSALDINTGKTIWRVDMEPICDKREECSPGLSAAITTIPGVVFSGALDGHLRAFSTEDGKIIWDVDTTVPVTATNGDEAHGGSIDADGPVIVDGQLYINSGYGFFGEQSGNLLMVYSVDGK